VDDFGQWPGLDQDSLQRMDEIVIARADVRIAVSETLQERMATRGRSSHLLTHGVDLEFWRQEQPTADVPALQGLKRPLVVFWGVLDRRMDLSFLERLGADLSRGTIVLAGPTADPDASVFKLPRVVHVGAMPYADLPQLAREAGVLVMPYALLPATQAMQPLKLKEYLATGRPVVVRDLPSTRGWSDCLDLAATPEGFSEAVRRRLRDGVSPEQAAARGRLVEEHWEAKADAFERWALREEASLDAVRC
jgi:glycosyltransferase involved in cell wall biosynthesis